MKYSVSVLIAVSLTGAAWAQLPGKPESFRIGVIGDSGTGGKRQYEVGVRLAEWEKRFPFEHVLMLGDNLYGSQNPKDFRTKFELPYAKLLETGVKFFAALGNHDVPAQQAYKPFNMGGRSYYTFRPHRNVRMFALDSNRMDKAQLTWLEKELSDSESDWKIVFFHHPLYSSGARHGSSLALRAALEPLFVKYGVAVVLSGHDHFYERLKPQKGVHYFVVGGSAKLRAGNARRTDISAKAFDRDNSFFIMEIDGDTLYFQAVSRTGESVDAGSFQTPAAERRTQEPTRPVKSGARQ